MWSGTLCLNLASTDYRRWAVWSCETLGLRYTQRFERKASSAPVAGLLALQEYHCMHLITGAGLPSKRVQRALAHRYLFNLQIQVQVNPSYFKVTLITSDEITLFGHDDVTKTTHESLWQKQWIQRRTFAVLHYYTPGVGDSVHWVSVFYWSKCTLSLM